MSQSIATLYKKCRICDDRHYIITSHRGFSFAKACECSINEKTKNVFCTECDGSGNKLTEDNNGYSFYRPCNCTQLDSKINKFNQSKIPLKFSDITIDSYVPASSSQGKVRRYIETFVEKYPGDSKGFVLMGPCGIGKTHLLASVVKILTLEKNIGCRFIDFFHLLQSIRNCYGAGISDSILLDPLMEVEILAIDELGKGKRDSEWEHYVLDQIISRRYNDGRVTIFTTNYTLDQNTSYRNNIGNSPYAQKVRFEPPSPVETLTDRVGERIYSRVAEMCEFIRLDGPDHRKTNLE